MKKTRELAANININTIESDTESSQAKIDGLLANIDQIGAYLPDLAARHNRTGESVSKEMNKTDAVQAGLDEFEKSNENLMDNLKTVNI